MSTPKETAEACEREATQIICVEIFKLPPTHASGTASRLVRCLVDAAVARVMEKVEAAKAVQPAAGRSTIGVRK